MKHQITSRLNPWTKTAAFGAALCMVLGSFLALAMMNVQATNPSDDNFTASHGLTPVRGHAPVAPSTPPLQSLPTVASSVVTRGGGLPRPYVVRSIARFASIGTRGHRPSPVQIAVAVKSPSGFQPVPIIGSLFSRSAHIRPSEEHHDLDSLLASRPTLIAILPLIKAPCSTGLHSRLPLVQPATILRV